MRLKKFLISKGVSSEQADNLCRTMKYNLEEVTRARLPKSILHIELRGLYGFNMFHHIWR